MNPAEIPARQDPLIKSATEDMTQAQKEELRSYIQQHPEIRSILQDFIANLLADKPEDIPEFANEYFSSLRKE